MSKRGLGYDFREKHREVCHMHQDVEETKMLTEESDMVRLKLFNFHIIPLKIIAQFKKLIKQLNYANIR